MMKAYKPPIYKLNQPMHRLSSTMVPNNTNLKDHNRKIIPDKNIYNKP